jgi:hypothetical protein
MLSQQPIELRLNTCLYTSSIPIFPQSINRKTKKNCPIPRSINHMLLSVTIYILTHYELLYHL